MSDQFKFTFMPWLGLNRLYKIGKVIFFPWDYLWPQIEDEEVALQINRQLSIYKKGYNIQEKEFDRVSSPCVLSVNGKYLLDNNDIWMIKPAINLLFFSILATGQRQDSYFNSNAFHYYIQPTSVGSNDVTFVTNGIKIVKSFASIDEVIAFKPLEAHSFDRFEPGISEDYIDAAKKLFKRKKKLLHISSSLDFLFQVYDDWHGNSPQLRISMLISAIETLVGQRLYGKERVLDEVEGRIANELRSKRKAPVIVHMGSRRIKYYSRATRILGKAYDIRNGFLHRNEMGNIGYLYGGKRLPIINMLIEIYKRLVILQLEDWNILKLGRANRLDRSLIISPLEDIFDEMVGKFRP